MHVIRATIDNEEVWFMGLLPRDDGTVDVAWSTSRAKATEFGEERAAVDTAWVLSKRDGAAISIRVEETRPAFSLDDAEATKARAWRDEHDQKHPGGDGAIGGRYTYSFTPTTLGVVAKVTCACGESVDLTNYEEW